MIAWSLQHGSETLFWITILISAVGICLERGLEPDNLHPPENRADTWAHGARRHVHITKCTCTCTSCQFDERSGIEPTYV